MYKNINLPQAEINGIFTSSILKFSREERKGKLLLSKSSKPGKNSLKGI
jgi:hypothetical protein